MGVRRYVAEAFARMMKLLLPPAPWDLEAGQALPQTLLASGDELERISQRAYDLNEESDPQITTELLAEWERELGITPGASDTDALRRSRIVSKLTRQQRFRPVDVQTALAPDLGLTAAQVEVIEVTAAQAAALGDATQIYQFYVFRDPALGGTWDIDAAQAILDEMAHSHTRGTVIESDDFLCDDPYSLCDRDFLGV